MGWFGRHKDDGPAVGVYGKHPAAADFIRLNAGSSTVKAFDKWFSAAQVTADRAIPDWEAVYDSAPITSFIFLGDDGARASRALVGCFAPSRDASGRRYPLIIFAEAEMSWLARHYPLLPHHPFMREVEDLLARAHELSSDDVFEAVSGQAPFDAGALAEATRLHQSYLNTTLAHVAFRRMLPTVPPLLHGAVLGTLKEFAGARSSRSTARYGLRLPLGDAGPWNAALWLNLLQQHGPQTAVPAALWSERALLGYRIPLHPKSLVALWQPEWTDDTVCDLGAPRPRSSSPGDMPSWGPTDPLRQLFG